MYPTFCFSLTLCISRSPLIDPDSIATFLEHALICIRKKEKINKFSISFQINESI